MNQPPSEQMVGDDVAKSNRDRINREQSAKQRADRLAELKMDIGPRYRECTIANFELSKDSRIAAKQNLILHNLIEYSDGFLTAIQRANGLGLIGPVGTGKDHLLSAMLIKVAGMGHRVRWEDGSTLFREFRSLIESRESEGLLIDSLAHCDVLALSDPVPPNSSLSPFLLEKLFSVIDRRYRAKKLTWFTLNAKTPEEAEQRLSPQILDRITDGAMLLFCDWPSYRKTRRWEGIPK